MPRTATAYLLTVACYSEYLLWPACSAVLSIGSTDVIHAWALPVLGMKVAAVLTSLLSH